MRPNSVGVHGFATAGPLIDSLATVGRREVGGVPHGEHSDPQTEHFMRDDGLRHWLFGTDASEIAKLPSNCGLPASL